MTNNIAIGAEKIDLFRHRAKVPLLALTAALAVSIFLGGCAAAPPTTRTIAFDAIAADLGLASLSKDETFECFYTLSPKGVTTAAYQEAVYIRQQDRIIFARREKQSGRFEVLANIEIGALREIRLYKYMLARQLQFELDNGVHSAILQIDGSYRLWIEANEREYAWLSARGVKHSETSVQIKNVSGPMIIPIFIK